MEILPWTLVLFSALLHASWNALLKTSLNHHLSITSQAFITGILSLCLIPFFPLPSIQTLPLLFAAACVHVAYNLSLASAYKIGDFGLVYPIARGSAPLVVLSLSFLILNETPSYIEIIAILLIVSGISCLVLQSHVSFSQHIKPAAIAFVTGILIASYTFLDGWGARINQNPHSFIIWLFFFIAILMTPILFAKRKQLLSLAYQTPVSQNILFKASIGAVLSYVAYWFVIWALISSPMASVSALREVSIIIAALISTTLLKEPFGLWRIISAVLVTSGTVLMGIHAALS
jgi:drug/metabolite transporter (DMT)-like permease